MGNKQSASETSAKDNAITTRKSLPDTKLPKLDIMTIDNNYRRRLIITPETPTAASIRQTIRDQATAKQEAKSSPKHGKQRHNNNNIKIDSSIGKSASMNLPRRKNSGRPLPTIRNRAAVQLKSIDGQTNAESPSRKKRAGATNFSSWNDGSSSSDNHSSTAQDSDSKPQNDSTAEEEKEEEDVHEISPQRRLAFLEVPVAASGALTKRVFEVRERAVDACPKSQYVLLEPPILCHTTTELMIVRWQSDNWADAKEVVNYELQWCQPSLEKGRQLMAFATVLTGSEGNTTETVEFACDSDFCTVPRKAVRVIDSRQEITIQGLPGGCAPLFFRVRAKVGPSKYEKSKTGGWCPWSSVTEAYQTLPDLCEALNPTLERQCAHLLKLKWQTPDDVAYGKVVSYQLCARMNWDPDDPEVERASTQSTSAHSMMLELGPSEWVVLYEGPANSFSVGVAEAGSSFSSLEEAPSEAERHAPVVLISDPRLAARREPYLPYELLPRNTAFDFRVTARTGAWFHGVFYYNALHSDDQIHRTLNATPDAPSIPYILPYHGIVRTDTVELRWKPPTTFGGGHTYTLYQQVYGQETQDWFGMSMPPPAIIGATNTSTLEDIEKRQEREGTQWGAVPWDLMGARHTRLEGEKVSMLRGEGWEKRTDESGREYWNNVMTGAAEWSQPTVPGIEGLTFQVLAKPVKPTPSWDSWMALYTGTAYKFVCGGEESTMPLWPGTQYEFKVACEGRFGKGTNASDVLLVETLPEETQKVTGDSETDLPTGWVECWDSGVEYCYYFNESTNQTQWTHPSGARKHDPNLSFRKKRVKLLNNLRRDFPPPEGYGALRLVINRKHIIRDSQEQLGSLPVEKLSLRTNITFENEEGIDSGGITNEWYMQLSRRFFEPKLTMFQLHAECNTYSIDPRSSQSASDSYLKNFRFVGRLIAKAIYDKRLLDLPLSTSVLKQLKGETPGMDDLFEIDPLFHTSLQWMLANDIEYVIFETFSVTALTIDGKEVVVDLVPDGRNVDVTNSNKRLYVEAVVAWHLRRSAQEQLNAMVEGMHEMLPAKYLHDFSVEEFRLLLNGSPIIRVRDLRKCAVYKGGYEATSKPVEYFWAVLTDMTQAERSQVLAFVTGCPKMPLDDFALVVVKSELGPDALPTSHTCFNQLVLPEHETRDQLGEKLMLALANGQGFLMS